MSHYTIHWPSTAPNCARDTFCEPKFSKQVNLTCATNTTFYISEVEYFSTCSDNAVDQQKNIGKSLTFKG